MANSSIGLGIQNTDNTNSAYIKNIGSSNQTLLSIDEKIYVKEDGSVGIGTTSPDTSLHIQVKDDSSGIDTANNRSGAVLRLTHDAQWQAGYGTPESNVDYLGGIEFETTDSSNGTGVRTAIKTTVDHYANSNSLVFYTAPNSTAGIVERLRIEGDGNVGIGTTSPDYKLSVNGWISAQADALSTDAVINLAASNDTNYSAISRIKSTSESDTNGSSSLTFSPRDSSNTINERMRITSDGNVGIGTTSPSANLEIKGGSEPFAIYDANDEKKLRTYTQSNGTVLALTDGGNDIIRLDGRTGTPNNSYFNGGNVGIGTTSPEVLLHVENSSTSTYSPTSIVSNSAKLARFRTKNNSGTDLQTASINLISSGNNGTSNAEIALNCIQETDTSAGAIFTVQQRKSDRSFHETLRIDSNKGYLFGVELATVDQLGGGGIWAENTSGAYYNGRVGIGTTTPSADLHVVGQGFFARNSDTTAPFFVEQFGEGPSGYFMGGNVGIGTTIPQAPLEIKGERPAIRLNDDDPTGQSNFEIVNNGGIFAIFDAANNSLGNLLTINGGGLASGAGNVGIGTSSPSQPLEIKAAQGQFGCHVVDDQGASYGGLYVQNNGGTGSGLALYLKEPAGQTKARISADSANPSFIQGQFGIGTTSPMFALDVADQVTLSLGADENNERENLTNKSSRVGGIHYDNQKDPVNMMMHYCSATENNLYFGWGTSAMVSPTKIVFGTASTTNTASSASTSNQRMVIDGSGQVGIGTTAPEQKFQLHNGHILQTSSSAANHVYMLMRMTGGSTGEYGLISKTHHYGTSGGSEQHYGRVKINTTYNSSDHAAAMKFYVSPATNDGGGANVQRLAFVLDSAGDGLFYQDLDVAGNLSKGSGTFKIDHPLPEKSETHHLVHSFIEGPQADNIYRGKVELVAGKAEVNIDSVSGMTEGTFVALNRDIQAFTSNESDWDAVRGKVEGNKLIIECQNAESTATISWLVIGERQDEHMLKSKTTDENGKLIVEPLKPEPEPEYEEMDSDEVVTEEPLAEEAPVEESQAESDPEIITKEDGKEYIRIGDKDYEVLGKNEDGSLLLDDDTTNNG